MTQVELAKTINYSQQLISDLETGRVPPTERFIQDIQMFLGISAHWLKTGEGEMFSSIKDSSDPYITAAFSYRNKLARLRNLEPILHVGFADRLKKYFQDNDLHETQYAEYLNITVLNLREKLSTDYLPDDMTIVQLRVMFNLNPLYLLSGKGEPLIKIDPEPHDQVITEINNIRKKYGEETYLDLIKILIENINNYAKNLEKK